MDARALDTRVKHITDRDLLAALNPRIAGMGAVIAAARDRDPMESWVAWRRYVMANRARRVLPTSDGSRGDLRHSIRQADRVLRRDIPCWGGVRIKYAGEVDFSRNLPGSSNYGFHYFGWIVPLLAAWRATGAEEYAQAFVEIFRQWFRQRDLVRGDVPGYDVIWYELGTGARMPVFTELYFATLDARSARDPEYHRDMLKTALGHGRWLCDHETEFRRGNSQVTGARALLAIGLAFPELRESNRWVSRGLRYVLGHAERDVYADGCHRERAPHYHLGVARNLVSTLELISGRLELAKAQERLREVGRRMLRFTVTIMTPSGHSPVVGDSEYDVPAAQLERDGEILRDPLLIRGTWRSARAVLPDSGFVVIRSGRRTDDLWFLLNYGPWGGGHSHAEALSFQLHSRGALLAVDCGRGVNYDDPLHRAWYVTPYAHNMVVVDGEAPSVAGRRGRLLWHTEAAGTHFLGLEHQGYRDIGVSHRRCFLVSERRRYLVVLDFLRSKGTHRYEWVLNTPTSGVRASRGTVRGERMSVVCADPAGVGRPSLRRVSMCLPLEGKSTWGLPRGRGTNVRFETSGASTALQFLLAPFGPSDPVRFTCERAGSRTSRRYGLVVEAPGFTERWVVDCAGGSITRA